jgi:hypothetical protein
MMAREREVNFPVKTPTRLFDVLLQNVTEVTFLGKECDLWTGP